MRIQSIALFIICSLLTAASAIRDYNLEIHLVNENAPMESCSAIEFDDLSNRFLPTLLAVLADPKYNLKATTESSWRKVGPGVTPVTRKQRQLIACSTCMQQTGGNTYLCYSYYNCYNRRLLRSERELSDEEVLAIKMNTEGAMHGLLNKFSSASPYSANCTTALLEGTIGSTLALI